jgi:hypothetical protein
MLGKILLVCLFFVSCMQHQVELKGKKRQPPDLYEDPAVKKKKVVSDMKKKIIINYNDPNATNDLNDPNDPAAADAAAQAKHLEETKRNLNSKDLNKAKESYEDYQASQISNEAAARIIQALLKKSLDSRKKYDESLEFAAKLFAAAERSAEESDTRKALEAVLAAKDEEDRQRKLERANSLVKSYIKRLKRKKQEEEHERRAALRIQSFSRGFLQRKANKEKNAATIFIQSQYRMNSAKRLKAEILLERQRKTRRDFENELSHLLEEVEIEKIEAEKALSDLIKQVEEEKAAEQALEQLKDQQRKMVTDYSSKRTFVEDHPLAANTPLAQVEAKLKDNIKSLFHICYYLFESLNMEKYPALSSEQMKIIKDFKKLKGDESAENLNNAIDKFLNTLLSIILTRHMEISESIKESNGAGDMLKSIWFFERKFELFDFTFWEDEEYVRQAKSNIVLNKKGCVEQIRKLKFECERIKYSLAVNDLDVLLINKAEDATVLERSFDGKINLLKQLNKPLCQTESYSDERCKSIQ